MCTRKPQDLIPLKKAFTGVNSIRDKSFTKLGFSLKYIFLKQKTTS